jgi:hypothetical protein
MAKRRYEILLPAEFNDGRLVVDACPQCIPDSLGEVIDREQAGLLVMTADPTGANAVSPQGHLRLPAPVRHRHGLAAGGRVLLVADPGTRRLVIDPPASLDAMVAGCYAGVFGGDAA